MPAPMPVGTMQPDVRIAALMHWVLLLWNALSTLTLTVHPLRFVSAPRPHGSVARARACLQLRGLCCRVGGRCRGE